MPIYISDYAPPVSWTDKGMNWAAPDPLRADYAIALWQALTERGILSSAWPPDPQRPLDVSKLRTIREAILAGCTDFFADENPLAGYPKEDVPKFTAGTFSQFAGSDFFMRLGDKTLPEEAAAWMIRAKQVLTRLRWREGSYKFQYQSFQLYGTADYPLWHECTRSTRASAYAEVQNDLDHLDFEHGDWHPPSGSAQDPYRHCYEATLSEGYSDTYYQGTGSVGASMNGRNQRFEIKDEYGGSAAAHYLAIRFIPMQGYGSAPTDFDTFDFFPAGTAAANRWSLFSFGSSAVKELYFDTEPARLQALFPSAPSVPDGDNHSYHGFDWGEAKILVDLAPILKFK